MKDVLDYLYSLSHPLTVAAAIALYVLFRVEPSLRKLLHEILKLVDKLESNGGNGNGEKK